MKSLCAVLDPEDAVKILKVSGSSYLIYEGNPGDAQGIEKAISSEHSLIPTSSSMRS